MYHVNFMIKEIGTAYERDVSTRKLRHRIVRSHRSKSRLSGGIVGPPDYNKV